MGTELARKVRPFKVYPETEQELKMFEALRLAYGFKTLGGLTRHILKNEAKSQTLVKNNLDKIKKESEG